MKETIKSIVKKIGDGLLSIVGVVIAALLIALAILAPTALVFLCVKAITFCLGM